MAKPYAGRDFEEYRGLDTKAWEKKTMCGALARLGFSEFKITPHERPDALVEFSSDDGSVHVGCEIQTLQSDSGASGSPLREFESRWRRVMERVVAELRSAGVLVPYCSVKFREPSYSSIRDIRDDQMVSELTAAGRLLRGVSSLRFPQSDMPTLTSILTEIHVVDPDEHDLLWWPTHLKSGQVPALDDTIVEAVYNKGQLATSFDWQGADEKWLLLVAEGRGLTDLTGGAREIGLPPDLRLPFTWVLAWDKFSEDIWAVYPDHAVICDGHEHLRRPKLLPQKLRRFCTGGEHYPTRPRA